MRLWRTKSAEGPCAAAAALLTLTSLLGGCGGGTNTGAFIDQNGFQIGTPKGPAPTAETRAAVARLLPAVVPGAGVTAAPTETRYTFDGGYTVTVVWKNGGVTGSSGRVEGPTPGLPAVFQVSLVGTTVEYTDFSLDYFAR